MNDHELDVLIKQMGEEVPHASAQLIHKTRLRVTRRENRRAVLGQISILLLIMLINLSITVAISFCIGKIVGVSFMLCTIMSGIVLLVSMPIIYLISYLLLNQEKNKIFIKGEDKLC